MRAVVQFLRAGGTRRGILIGLTAFAGVLAAAVLFLLLVPAGDGATVRLVECGKGMPLSRAATEMDRQGIIRSAASLVWLARLKGQDSKVQAGVYRVSDAMTPAEILRKMVDGDIYAYRFAVPEGYSIYQLAELLDGRKIHGRDEFLAACADRALLDELQLPGPTVEGYLFPATYNITPGATPADTIRMMVRQFASASKEILPPDTLDGRSRHRLVILASMIEKEAVDPKEQPLIASVFHNRLKKGMRLQSDPTAVYGDRPFSGRVTRSDVLRMSPYNTYRISGLPPGPIGNPGAGALQAALTPQSSPYLYFVARKDGTHHFSTTLDQHNMAVNKYLKN